MTRAGAVIFDCDGVLVDSETIDNEVLTGLLEEVGVDITYEDVVRDYRGKAMATLISMAEERLGNELTPDFADRYYDSIKARFARELEPIPGVVEALERIDLPSCVASSGPHHKMEVTLRLTGLWDRFEGRIFSAEDVGIGKPAPDLFLHAAAVMGFEPDTTVVVEDSLPGAEAARAAGMRCLGYARDTPASDLESRGAEPFTEMSKLPELIAAPYVPASNEEKGPDRP